MSSSFPKLITKPARIRLKLDNPSFRAKISSPIIIKGHKMEYYHRMNQVYHKYKPLKLISAAWHKSTKNGDYFSILPFKPNAAVPTKSNKFQHLGLSSKLVGILDVYKIRFPTPVQISAFHTIFQRNKHCAIFAATGSGKTLAYLLPVIQSLLSDHTVYEKNIPRHPFCVIMVPTDELCRQVHEVCLKFRDVVSSRHIHTSMTPLELFNSKEVPASIVVATPMGVVHGMKKGLILLNYCKYLVLDESDTLLDQSFYPAIQRILPKIIFADANPSMFCQMVFCGATLPKNLTSIFESFTAQSGNLEIIQGAAVENVQGHVKQDFFRIAPSKVQIAVRDLLSELSRKPGVTLIFCNSQISVRKLSYFLENEGIKHETLYGDVNKTHRHNIMQLLCDGFIKVLVTTDVISRGFDTLNVDCVINYDCPLHLSDYVHRAGRVGRIGQARPGRVITYVSRPYHAEIVREIEKSVRLSRPLIGVDSNIKQHYADYAEVKMAKKYEEEMKSEDDLDTSILTK